MLKWVIGSAVALVVLCGGGMSILAFSPAGKKLVEALKPKERIDTVRVEPVSRGELVRTVNVPGLVEPRTKVQIGAQVSAKIIGLPFREGDDVKAGDVLVRLDPEEYQAQLDSAMASLLADEAQLEGLRAALREQELAVSRARELFSTSDISRATLDGAEAAYERALATVRAGEQSVAIANANIVRARKNLAFCTITAPIDGTITKLNNEVGEQVLGTFNNMGTTVMELADLSTMIIQARVDETNIASVRSGQAATIFLAAYPGREFTGRVERVGFKRERYLDGTNYISAEILLDLPEGLRLRDGLNANADIQVDTQYDVIRVPSQAVLDRRVEELPAATRQSPNVDRDKTFARVVYRLVDGKAAVTPVRIGVSDLTHTVILAGLQEGDPVIVGPYTLLSEVKDGRRVKPEEPPAATPATSAATETASTGTGETPAQGSGG